MSPPDREDWGREAKFGPDFLSRPAPPASKKAAAPQPAKRAAKATKREPPESAPGKAARTSAGTAAGAKSAAPKKAAAKKAAPKRTTGSPAASRQPAASGGAQPNVRDLLLSKTETQATSAQPRARTAEPTRRPERRALPARQPARRARQPRGSSRADLLRPTRFPSVWSWATAGFRRHPLGSLAGLIAGWSGLVAALVAFVLFLVIGGLEALIQAFGGHAITFVHDFRLNIEIGVVSIFAALISPILQPLFFVLGIAVAEVVVLGGALTEPSRLALRGYRKMSQRERSVVEPLLRDAAGRMGLSRLPLIRIADDPLPGAWTHIRTIVLSEGLGLRPEERQFSDAELEAILAHELQHWAHGDSAARLFAWACALPVAIPYGLAFGIMSRPPNTKGLPRGLNALGGLIGFVAALVFWPTWILVRWGVAPIIALNARQQEYSADAASAAALGEQPMSAVLERLRRTFHAMQDQAHDPVPVLEPSRSVYERALHASHPPIELRLDALTDPDPRYPVPASDDAPLVRGRVFAAIALAAVGIGIIATLHKPVTHHAKAATASTGNAIGPVTFTPYGGSRRSANGVPQGYPHTEMAAVDAATNDQLTVIRLLPLSAAAANRLVDDMAAPASAAALRTTVDGDLTSLQQITQAHQISHYAETAQPLGYQVESYDGDHAVVRIWLHTVVSATNASGTQGGPALGYADWSLSWVGGDWKVSDIGPSTDVPDQALPSQAAAYNPPAPTVSFG